MNIDCVSPVAPQKSVLDPHRNSLGKWLPSPSQSTLCLCYRCSVSNKTNFIFLYMEECMPTHHLSVWTTLTMLLTRSLIGVLFIIVPSASEERRKAKRKGGDKGRKKQAVCGVTCQWRFLCVSVQCNSVFERKVRGPERLSNLGKVTYIRCFTC